MHAYLTVFTFQAKPLVQAEFAQVVCRKRAFPSLSYLLLTTVVQVCIFVATSQICKQNPSLKADDTNPLYFLFTSFKDCNLEPEAADTEPHWHYSFQGPCLLWTHVPNFSKILVFPLCHYLFMTLLNSKAQIQEYSPIFPQGLIYSLSTPYYPDHLLCTRSKHEVAR